MTPGVVLVRPATPGDAPFITSLARQLAAVSRLAWLPREATDRFAASGCQQAAAAISQPRHLVLIASDEAGNQLGFLHATIDESVFTGEHVGYVSTVAITAEARGTGIGRRLMLATEQWARRQDCALMTLEVFAQNTTARAAYARLGYQEQTLKLAKPL
jgi:GNAT superfamily N-acetyltransferase